MFDAVSTIGMNLASRSGVAAAKADILTKMFKAIGARDVVEETGNPHRASGKLTFMFEIPGSGFAVCTLGIALMGLWPHQLILADHPS